MFSGAEAAAGGELAACSSPRFSPKIVCFPFGLNMPPRTTDIRVADRVSFAAWNVFAGAGKSGTTVVPGADVSGREDTGVMRSPGPMSVVAVRTAGFEFEVEVEGAGPSTISIGTRRRLGLGGEASGAEAGLEARGGIGTSVGWRFCATLVSRGNRRLKLCTHLVRRTLCLQRLFDRLQLSLGRAVRRIDLQGSLKVCITSLAA